jgi:hypothetical protein
LRANANPNSYSNSYIHSNSVADSNTQASSDTEASPDPTPSLGRNNLPKATLAFKLER